MEIVTNVALISVNETLFVQVFSFLIFLFLINRIMIRPLQATMRERDGYVHEIQSSIRESEHTLVEMHDRLRSNEESAIREAGRQREILMKTAAGQAEQLLEKAQREINEIREKNMSDVDHQISEARKSLAEEAEKLSLQMMEKILDREVARDFSRTN